VIFNLGFIGLSLTSSKEELLRAVLGAWVQTVHIHIINGINNSLVLVWTEKCLISLMIPHSGIHFLLSAPGH
jgi:hypothetical protein